MLTLLPFASFQKSAASFFDATLVQQLQEVESILNVIHRVNNEISSWDFSPSVLMWTEHVPQLCAYGLAMCDEVVNRRDIVLSAMTHSAEEKINWHFNCATSGQYTLLTPFWFGLPILHESHQAELIRRDKKYDSVFETSDKVPLYWPVVKI